MHNYAPVKYYCRVCLFVFSLLIIFIGVNHHHDVCRCFGLTYVHVLCVYLVTREARIGSQRPEALELELQKSVSCYVDDVNQMWDFSQNSQCN